MKKFLSLLASLLLLPLLTMAAEPRKTLAAKSIDSNKNLPNSMEPKGTDIGPLSAKYYPIKDLNSEYIEELAEFAVHEHDKKTGDNLQYPKVYAGEFQREAGYNFKLSISAAHSRGGLRLNFEALVHDDLMGKRTLESFVYKPDDYMHASMDKLWIMF